MSMKKSEQINELAAALSKAQGSFENAKKDTKNPFFNSRYADLTAVWEACREALSKNGLSVTQTLSHIEGRNFLITTLLHSSGQWIGGEMPLITGKQDMQGLGSALSYARRYSLAAICGISQEDDDGEAAKLKSKPELAPEPVVKKSLTSGAIRSPQAVENDIKQPTRLQSAEQEITQDQITRLYTIVTNSGWTNDEAKLYMETRFHATSSKQLTRKQYDEMCAYIQANPVVEANDDAREP